MWRNYLYMLLKLGPFSELLPYKFFYIRNDAQLQSIFCVPQELNT